MCGRCIKSFLAVHSVTGSKVMPDESLFEAIVLALARLLAKIYPFTWIPYRNFIKGRQSYTFVTGKFVQFGKSTLTWVSSPSLISSNPKSLWLKPFLKSNKFNNLTFSKRSTVYIKLPAICLFIPIFKCQERYPVALYIATFWVAKRYSISTEILLLSTEKNHYEK